MKIQKRVKSKKSCNAIAFNVFFFTFLNLSIFAAQKNKIMFVISEIAVHSEIPTVQFACDLGECKGACCSMKGAGGAPLEKNEITEIEKSLPFVLPYLSHRHNKNLASQKFYYSENGKLALTSVNDKDCIFAFKENGIAKCSFEKAYFNNEISFRKPISCQLFPIRIQDFGGAILHYEKIDECSYALKRGKREKISLHNFLQEGLERKFGAEWYQQFHSQCELEFQNNNEERE